MVLLVARVRTNCPATLFGFPPMTDAVKLLTLAVKVDNPDRSRTASAVPTLFVPLGSIENEPFGALTASEPPRTKETRVVAVMPPIVVP